MWSHGVFHWNELVTWDAKRAQAFYGEVIGWTFEEVTAEGQPYWLIKMGEQVVGGMFQLQSPAFDGVQEGWLAYLAVDDVDARVARAVAAGATLHRPIFEVAMVGRIAMLREPGGAGIGWITPAPMSAEACGGAASTAA